MKKSTSSAIADGLILLGIGGLLFAAGIVCEKLATGSRRDIEYATLDLVRDEMLDAQEVPACELANMSFWELRANQNGKEAYWKITERLMRRHLNGETLTH